MNVVNRRENRLWMLYSHCVCVYFALLPLSFIRQKIEWRSNCKPIWETNSIPPHNTRINDIYCSMYYIWMCVQCVQWCALVKFTSSISHSCIWYKCHSRESAIFLESMKQHARSRAHTITYSLLLDYQEALPTSQFSWFRRNLIFTRFFSSSLHSIWLSFNFCCCCCLRLSPLATRKLTRNRIIHYALTILCVETFPFCRLLCKQEHVGFFETSLTFFLVRHWTSKASPFSKRHTVSIMFFFIWLRPLRLFHMLSIRHTFSFESISPLFSLLVLRFGILSAQALIFIHHLYSTCGARWK